MKSLVIFDSVFGNTEKIARAIASGLPGEVEVVRVGDAKLDQLAGLDLLVIGSPTRGWQPTPATQTFIRSIPVNCVDGVRVAGFDTRVKPEDVNSMIGRLVLRIGSVAAVPIARTLKQKGGIEAASPEGFYVANTEGPLKDGEIERAAEWGKQLAG
jgi:flavodoxin